MQSPTAENQEWPSAFKRILGLTRNSPHFLSQPKANRFSTILETFVPSRKNPTYDKILDIVNALIKSKAIRADEGGVMFNALLERVAKYNSKNVQTNLDFLIGDVKEALAQKERKGLNQAMGSLVAFNSFLSTLPATVSKGQDDYVSFIGALKIYVVEVPQTDVYQSGPAFFLQTTRNGSHTVNLTKAFQNLQPLWGVKAPQTPSSSVSTLLTPNTRLLLLLIAPFTSPTSMSKESYIGHLLTLYRETIGHAHLNETTFKEITEVSRALGNENIDNLQSTLNFLLTKKKNNTPQVFSLTAEEERILRYVQQAASLYIQQGFNASAALDQTSANFEPSLYNRNREFINKLMDYLHRAASMYPDYFTNAVLNPKWLPPEGFYTGDFDFPEVTNGLLWDDFESVFLGQNQNERLSKEDPRQFETISSRNNDTSGSRLSLLSSVSTPQGAEGPLVRSRAQSFSLWDEPRPKNQEREFETLTQKLARWKTYKDEVEARKRQLQGDDDDIDGSGRPVPFFPMGTNSCW
ncbi:pIIIa [Egyptian fruit bat adenovirus]|uniref:PIIIa n=1 Tax=Egyptian fruit bat adenovirus TaxID=2849732 RepID=A0A344X9U5_9ADEN|nr:pIIIa [Rousettus aegyptiacus adenovirus]AXE75627.1 pIIIa [Egyptian fruit bat adenovirus]